MRTERLSLAGSLAATLFLAACSDTPSAPNRTFVPEAPLESRSEGDSRLREVVGSRIFFDKSLSVRGNQSCASCHDPEFGFTHPDATINAHGAVGGGSIAGRFGTRRPPTAAYATFSPTLAYNTEDEVWVGGNFWDGRATGQVLGNPAADQALQPFLTPNEQASPDLACVVYRVAQANYSAIFKAAWGRSLDDINFPQHTKSLCSQEGKTVPLSARDRAAVQEAYNQISLSIAAFEASPAVSPFNSRFDHWREGRGSLNAEERQGFELFNDKANCAACHPNNGKKALFTDFTYDNIGTPANPENPAFIASGFLDRGLGVTVNDPELYGAMKVPTLRNIDKRPTPFASKSYMHNGAFKSLEQVVHFYNTRDVLPTCAGVVLPNDPRFGRDCWPAPEVAATVNRDELGNLGLTPSEERALVAYLRTLSDRN